MAIDPRQQKQIEFNRVYRRLESADRTKMNDHLIPSLEIRGQGNVSIWASNLPRIGPNFQELIDDIYTCPIADNEIETKMFEVICKLCQGFHDASLMSTWIAFINNTPSMSLVMYDCGIIDWEFEFRRKNPNLPDPRFLV
jgi:hypothetical protein